MKTILSVTCAALLMLTGCAGWQKPKGSESGPARMGVTETYDIPCLSNLTIDGRGEDWGDRGFRVDVFGESQPHRWGDVSRSPQLRLGWNDEGLVFLVTVHDVTPIESESDRLALGDSVMVTVATRPEEAMRVAMAAGRSRESQQLRCVIDDLRAEKRNPDKLTVQTACMSTAGGYVMEGIIPFANLKTHAALGTEFGVQVHVFDRLSQKDRVAYQWGKGDVTEKADLHTRVKLAKQPSAPIRFAANAEYVGYQQMRIRVNDVEPGHKKIDVAMDGWGNVASIIGDEPGRHTMMLPFGLISASPTYLTFTRNGQEVARMEVTPPTLTRQQFLHSAEFRFNSYVFDGTVFPGGDFVEPSAVEDAVRPYTLRITYYDADFHEVTRADKPGRYGAIVDITCPYGETDRRFVTLYRVPGKLTNWQQMELSAKDIQLPKEFGISPTVLNACQKQLSETFRMSFHESARRSDGIAVLLAGMAESTSQQEPVVDRTGPEARNQRWWHELKNRLAIPQDYKYLVRLPKNYDTDKAQKYPLILYLHGSGERGENLSIIKNNPVFRFMSEHSDLPFIVVAPQCPSDTWWKPLLLKSLLAEVSEKYRVDPDRIYLTGLSMGGYGTWQTAMWYPELFAAIVPICGIGDAADMSRIKNLPTWVFHGDADPLVPFELDRLCVEALKSIGGNVKMTVYPGVGHNSWTQTYANPDVYKWLLEQKRK
ncbi:MAG: prolyl oligopeptidase family serine peptidase [Phycisphaerales bacterium]|nr:prolyl oligopeptidase family serine peptidase [Phycisphaerales bacterium]